MIMYRLASRLVHTLASSYVTVAGKRGDPVWQDRLLTRELSGPVDMWLHAASAGETRVAVILTEYMLKRRPDLKVHFTVMTEAGYQAGKSLLGDRVTISYYPLDFEPLVDELCEALQPRVIAVAETEIWPHMVQVAAERYTPLVLVNGRMSRKGYSRYRKTRRMWHHLLNRYERFFLRTLEDRDRFAAFGVPSERMVVTGDMKFDAPLPERSATKRKKLRENLGVAAGAFVLVAGSTRPGEEEQLLDVYQSLRRKMPSLRMVLAPRHIDRVPQVRELIAQASLQSGLYTEGAHCSDEQVVVVDEMGVLADLYQAGDVAFVGGTLVDLGGHNILEPVWAGTAVLYGPFVNNVMDAADYIEKHKFGTGVQSVVEFRQVLEKMIAGEQSFGIKTESAGEASATAEVASYLFRLIDAEDVMA